MGRWLLLFALVSAAGLLGAASSEAAEPKVFKDWTLVCPEERLPPCVLHQRIVNEEQQQLLEIVLDFRAADGSHPLTVELPLGILLPAGVSMKIDDQVEFSGMGVTRCLAGGCLVERLATDEMLEAMKRGGSASFVMGLPDGRKLALVFSLQGFTAALAALEQANAAQ